MKHRSPLVTLAAVVVFFAALMTANYLIHPVGEVAANPAEPPASAPASAAPTAAPTSGSPSYPASPTPSAAERGRFPREVTYAGRTADGRVAVAVAVLGNRAAAYVCDGRGFEAWLSGTVDEDEVTLRSGGGATLEAKLDGGRLAGQLRAGDRRWSFRLRVADKPAGIYRASGSRSRIGWIVLPDGSQVGLATDDAGQISPAHELDPAQGRTELNGQLLTAEPVQGDSDI